MHSRFDPVMLLWFSLHGLMPTCLEHEIERHMRQRYRRKADQLVTAICLALDFDGLDFRKWGDSQHADPGDWLVDNNGDVHTVDADTFTRTYQQVSPGRWIKVSDHRRRQCDHAGRAHTLPGGCLARVQ